MVWGAEVYGDEFACVARSAEGADGSLIRNITMLLKSAQGGVVTDGLSARPGRPATALTILYDTYDIDGKEWFLPTDYRRKVTDPSGAIVEQVAATFSDYKVLDASTPLTLQDLGVPDEALFLKMYPNEEVGYYLWKDGALSEVDAEQARSLF